jgi:hypothetical protein
MGTTLKQVNPELLVLGKKEFLVRGIKCFFFMGGNSAKWRETAVMVPRIGMLSVVGWIKQYDKLSKDIR